MEQPLITLLSSWQTYLVLAILAFALQCIITKFKPGLHSIPGPWLASISSLDRVWGTALGTQMNYHLDLHRRYGTVVRVGPSHVSVSDPSAIPQLYGIAGSFHKSEWYSLFDIKTPTGQPASTVFSVRDEAKHRAIKRPIAAAYSLSTLKELEPMNDACSAIFLRKMEEKLGQDIDLGQWVHWYAFDVITSITFSNRLDMMEQERDVDHIIEAIEGRLVYNSVVGQIEGLHRYLFGNAFVSWVANKIPAIAVLNSSRYIVDFAAKQLQRYQSGKDAKTGDLADLLDRFKMFKDGEQVMSDAQLLSHSVSNIFAGSDTTAATLRALLYYLCRTPQAHEKLLKEIDTADRENRLSDPVTFAEAQELVYFQAVIKESLRMHPAVGMLMERVVPAGGAEVAGTWLPGGTIVGMNPWVTARDESVYGKDAATFRPERWLEADAQQLKAMDRNSLAFGGGSRTCLGRNISMLEISKFVPQVLRRFDFELSNPEKEWTLSDYWFVSQHGVFCKVMKR